MTTYPFGYLRPPAGGPQGMGTQLTLAQYETYRTVRNLNFEFKRRVFALMERAAFEGVPLGIGAGWRVQPVNGGPGFASPGNSNHEGFPADGVSGGAVAADMVPDVSWSWMGRMVASYGLRTFAKVNNEPWHIQPYEIPASRNRRTAPWVLQPYILPGPPIKPSPIVYDPAHHKYGLFPAGAKPNLPYGAGYGNVGIQPTVEYLSHAILFETGQYLPENLKVLSVHHVAAVQNIQRLFNLPVAVNWQHAEVVVGQATWGAVDFLTYGRYPH